MSNAKNTKVVNRAVRDEIAKSIDRLVKANYYHPTNAIEHYPEYEDDLNLVGKALNENILNPSIYGSPPTFSPFPLVKESTDGGVRLTSSGKERVEFEGGGVRDSDAGRPRFDLLMPILVPYGEQLLTRIAAHMAKGADHYSPRNWEKFGGVEELERCQASLSRHFMQYMTDVDDGEDHAAAIYFNIMAIEYIKGKIRGDW